MEGAVRRQNPLAWLVVILISALAFFALLASTNHGVGVGAGSIPLIEAARAHRVWSGAPAYSAIVTALTSPKHDAPAAARLINAACLCLTVGFAALSVIGTRRETYRFLLAPLLVLAGPWVLRDFGILRADAMLTCAAMGSLACAQAAGRNRGALPIAATFILVIVTASSGLLGLLIFPAAIVAAIGGAKAYRLPWGHLAFAVVYALFVTFVTAHPAYTYAPSIAAAAVFVASLGRLIATATSVCALAFAIPWTIRAEREGHDFASPAWKHSATMLSIAHLPKGSVYYTNAPEAVARYDRHVVKPVPNDDADWKELTTTLTTRESFVVWFNGEPGDLEAIESHVSLEPYEQTADGVLYRADASAWAGGQRRIAFNPDTPSIPARRSAGHSQVWNEKHDRYVAQAKAGGIDLLFLGDSITDDYRTVPGAAQFFEERYGPYHPANFGIDGDRTQHLLYRILSGECDHISPKVAIILIGTNNTGEDSAPAIAKGIKACVEATRQKLSTTRILLLGLFPRGGSPVNNDKRKIIVQVNKLLAPLDDGDAVRYLNLYDKFLEADGTLSKEIMYDSLHPSLKGYHVWADAMQPLLDQMMHAAPLKAVTTQPTTRSN